MTEEHKPYKFSFWTIESKWGDMPEGHELPSTGFFTLRAAKQCLQHWKEQHPYNTLYEDSYYVRILRSDVSTREAELDMLDMDFGKEYEEYVKEEEEDGEEHILSFEHYTDYQWCHFVSCDTVSEHPDEHMTIMGGFGRVYMNAHADHCNKLWKNKCPSNIVAKLEHEVCRHMYGIYIAPAFKKIKEERESEDTQNTSNQ